MVAGWAGSMALYDLAVFDPSDPVLDTMWRHDPTLETEISTLIAGRIPTLNRSADKEYWFSSME
ncbi:Photosystem antenna protein-like protein, partial [Cynara cardunculus var. scolymus]